MEAEERKEGKRKGKVKRGAKELQEDLESGVPLAPTLADFCPPEVGDADSVIEDGEHSAVSQQVNKELDDEPVVTGSSAVLESSFTNEGGEGVSVKVVSSEGENERELRNVENFTEIRKDLHHMEPHFFLSKELQRLSVAEAASAPPTVADAPSAPPTVADGPPSAPSFPHDDMTMEPTAPCFESPSASYLVESSAPFLGASSAPCFDESSASLLAESSAPLLEGSSVPMWRDCTAQQLEQFNYYSDCVEQPSSVTGSELEFPSSSQLTPFTDTQLHALYHNVELEKNFEFVAHWLDTQKEIERFELDELLTNYQRVRLNLISTKKQYDNIKQSVDSLQENLWELSKERLEEEGECEDGREVVAIKEKNNAEFNVDNAKTLRSQFKQGRELLEESYSLYNFRTELCRLKIDQFIHVVLERSRTSSTSGQEGRDGGGLTSPGSSPRHTGVYTPQEELRLTVSVLFKFLRKDLSDEKLSRDLRIWLDRTIGVVLSNATLYDHLFILNHIMRCPAGVGKWAASYIQPAVPVTDTDDCSFDNPHLDHLITILATILLPVKERANFLLEFKIKARSGKQDFGATARPEDAIWTVLDNEGSEEEDPEESWSELREGDLVALLNQIPIDHMFRYVLRIEERDNTDQYDIRRSTQNSMLKLYAFSTQFVYLLREGLATFNTPKYRQLAKRLGRLIRHTVHHVSDHWENFRLAHNYMTATTGGGGGMMDSAMFQRLQLEYDHFFLRATKCIFSSMKLGIWQYLADIPYGTISPGMLWRIFYVLHLDYREEHHADFGSEVIEEEEEDAAEAVDWATVLASPDLQIQFEEKCAEADEAELYYLLAAFANMAQSRSGRTESEFIRRVTMDLFCVGFVCEATRDICAKNCRDLLASVCTQHPFVISYILELMKMKTSEIGKLCGYLFLELPWLLWRPTPEDVQLIFSWLSSPLNSVENHLARTILSSLNWEHGVLPSQFHKETALAVISCFLKLALDMSSHNMGYSSMVTMTNLAMVTVTNKLSADQQFYKWAWETLSRLHLHLMDCSVGEYRGILAGNQQVFTQLMDFDLSPEIEPVVSAAVSKQPIACYGALMLTQVGHSLPEILERGLPLIRVILDSGRLDHVMELLMHIIPIFLADPKVVENDHLIYIINKIVNADHTYLSMAKTIITRTFPGPVTKEMGNMMQSTVRKFESVMGISKKDIIHLWLKIICQIPSWNTNSSALYLVDIICAHAFNDAVCYPIVASYFDELYESMNKTGTAGGLLSMITSFGSSGHQLILSGSTSQFIWLAYFVLQSEENYYHKTGLWRGLVMELSNGKGLEVAIVNASKSADIPAPSSSQMLIYRWAQQAMDTPSDHPIMFAFWQKFFAMFLSRPPGVHDGEEKKGIGMCFFDGLMNTMYYGKIKACLKKKIEFFTNKTSEENEAPTSEIMDQLCKLFKTFFIWVEESKVLDSALYIPSLSPVYDPTKLLQLLSGHRSLWMEYFDPEKLGCICDEAVKEWNMLHFRKSLDVVNKLDEKMKKPSATERIISRLQGYESRLPPPPLRKLAEPIPSLHISTSIETMVLSLNGPLYTLNELSTNHSNNTLEYGSLNCSYLEIVPTLWKEEEMSVHITVPCKGAVINKEQVDCCGPAIIPITYQESKKHDGIAVRLESNRKSFLTVESKLLSTTATKFVIAASVINSLIQKILYAHEKDLRKGILSNNFEMACHMFQCLARNTTESWLTVPPLRHFISTCLDNLASVIVSHWPDQAIVILDILKDAPYLSPMLTQHFAPNMDNSIQVLDIYSRISQLPDGDGSLPFVLLSKLDIERWLQSQPEMEVIQQIIGLIFNSLKITGHDPETPRQMIHGLHRKQLSILFNLRFPMFYSLILTKLLKLSGVNQIDPDVWYDILNAIVGTKNGLKPSLENEENMKIVRSYTRHTGHDIGFVLSIVSEVGSHFVRERNEFGLYGLYPKYRSYVKPLATYFSLLSQQIVHAHTSLNHGQISKEAMEFIWKNMVTLYDPWLVPLAPAARSSTANWIQQLTDEGTPMLPWIPGDSTLAKFVVDSLVENIKLLNEMECETSVLSELLSMYSNNYAHSVTKDHIFGVVHPAFAALSWSSFKPSMCDIDAMMKIIGLFLPQSHAFLGTIFVQIDWQTSVMELSARAENFPKLMSAMLCLLIKLSSEPSVRQNGRLLGIVTQAEKWQWKYIDASHYESLAQWFVMSVDSRCIIKHKERNPLDAAVIRLFLSAAEFNSSEPNSNPNINRKQQMWVKCCVKMLSSVCSKQKSFLSNNQPALHTTIRKLLEDIELSADKPNSCASGLIKEYLALFNTPTQSVLPGSVLVVTQSWLALNTGSSPLVPAILQLAGQVLKDAKLTSPVIESALETFFKDNQEDESFRPTWHHVKGLIQWPSGNKVKEVLDEAVKAGHCLLLYAYLDLRHGACLSSQEEHVLASTLLEYLRLLVPLSVVGLETKLPLLYRKLLILFQRLLEFSSSSSQVVNMIQQFSEILLTLADSNPGWSQNILGAIGLGSAGGVSVRGKFLARALATFLLSLLSADKTKLLEKAMELSTDSGDMKMETLSTTELKTQLEKLGSLKSNKGFSAFHDLISWVITQIEDSSNKLRDSHLFVDHLVRDRLYTELYINPE